MSWSLWEQHFLPHYEPLCGLDKISCGFSANPLVVSVVGESSVIGSRVNQRSVYRLSKERGWGGR